MQQQHYPQQSDNQIQPVSERRYKPETFQKAVELASRLQLEHRETMTAQEIESIGREVGIDPAFIQQALVQLTEQQTMRQPRKRTISASKKKAVAAAWWAAGWTLPLILVILGSTAFHGSVSAALFFLGWAIYIGGGIVISVDAAHSQASPPRLSRAALLDTLFTLQRALEGQKRHCAFLSVDVVGSSDMKRTANELSVEHSFSQFRRWVEEVVQANGGTVQSAAGDGMMCMFYEDAAAVRAAAHLQKGVPQFNASLNRLPVPFRLRCGVSAGEVAIEEGVPLGHVHSSIIDRAAQLQKRAAEGDIVVSSEVAAAALIELGGLTALPDATDGQPAFSWKMGR
jgi:class 3 adenylate cyclase